MEQKSKLEALRDKRKKLPKLVAMLETTLEILEGNDPYRSPLLELSLPHIDERHAYVNVSLMLNNEELSQEAMEKLKHFVDFYMNEVETSLAEASAKLEAIETLLSTDEI